MQEHGRISMDLASPMGMQASPIDPRDTTWECNDPTYRVYFWSSPADGGRAHTSYEWRITDAADVYEVIAWAESERADRTYELFVEHSDRMESRTDGWTDAPGLIQLAGFDPTYRRPRLSPLNQSDGKPSRRRSGRSTRPALSLPELPH